MSTPSRSSSRQRSPVMLLWLVSLIVVAVVGWRAALRQRSQPSLLGGGDRSRAAVKPVQPSTPEAARIIARSLKLYSSLRSYQDTGTVTTVFQEQHRFDSVKTFRTAFVRPNRLFYEYTTMQGTPKDLYAVWTMGKPIRCWWSRYPGTKICDTLFIAMERARTYSEGAAQTVTRLLDPSLGRWSLKELTGVHVIGTEPVDQRVCYKLEGVNEYQDRVTVWIDRESSLLRKLVLVRRVRGSETAESTEMFIPRINQPVAEKTFAFAPPKA